MGLFSTKKRTAVNTNWKVLESQEQLDQALADSHQKTVVLFKHSVTCGISAMAEHRLQSEWDFDDSDFDFYYLDLLSYRPISNRIAEVLNVTHQSPQVIVVKEGKAVQATSHQAISTAWLKKAI